LCLIFFLFYLFKPRLWRKKVNLSFFGIVLNSILLSDKGALADSRTEFVNQETAALSDLDLATTSVQHNDRLPSGTHPLIIFNFISLFLFWLLCEGRIIELELPPIKLEVQKFIDHRAYVLSPSGFQILRL
jgi:hypothetical protein